MNGNYYSAKPSSEDKRILLVEDDPNFGTQRLLSNERFRCYISQKWYGRL